MKYMGQTFSYLKKNFWLPVVAMVIPSIVACFLSTPYWEVSFVAAFDYDPYLSASQTFRILFGDSWQYFWPVVVVAVVQVFGASLVMSGIDRHFRTGRLSLRDPLRLINNSVFPIAIGVTVMSAASIIWRFLLFGLVMLVQVSADAMALPAGAALAVISALAVGMFIIHGLIITPMLFWAPIMFVYGYRFRDAAATSFKLIAGKKIFRGLFMPMVLLAGVQLLVGFLQAPTAVAYVVNFFVFLATNVYATVYTVLTFYGISELDRRDIEPYRNIPLPVLRNKQEKENADRQPQKTDNRQASADADGENTQNASAKPPRAVKPKKTDNNGSAKKKRTAQASPAKKRAASQSKEQKAGDDGV